MDKRACASRPRAAMCICAPAVLIVNTWQTRPRRHRSDGGICCTSCNGYTPCITGDVLFRSVRRATAFLALEEPHLHARELNHVVIVQAARLRTDGHSVDQRVIVFL